MAAICNLHLHLPWRLETHSRSFYYFDQLRIYCDLIVFRGWCWLFLIISVEQWKNEKPQTHHFWSLFGFRRPSPPNKTKAPLKFYPWLSTFSSSFMTKWKRASWLYSTYRPEKHLKIKTTPSGTHCVCMIDSIKRSLRIYRPDDMNVSDHSQSFKFWYKLETSTNESIW